MKRLTKGCFDILRKNPLFGGIVTVQAVILLMLGIRCLRERCDLLFTQENLSVVSENVESTMAGDGEIGYRVVGEEYVADETKEDVDSEEADAANEEKTEDSGETILSTGYFTLYPGAYRVTVHYDSRVGGENDYNTEVVTAAVQAEGYSVYYHFEDLLLRDGMDAVNQTLQLTPPGKMENMKLNVDFYGMGELTVYSVEVREIMAYRFLNLLLWLLVFIIFDVIFYRLFVNKNVRGRKELAVLVCVCMAGILPFVADYVFMGHDSGFHAYRIVLLAEEISNGNYFPAIYSSALNGYGYAAPLFYNQLFLYLPAILYLCGFSLTFVYNLYLGIMTVTTCVIMYYCALKILKKENMALLAAALYTLSAVRLTNVFTRAAFGELTAQTFLPLVVLGFYNIYTAKKGEKITISKYWPVVVGMTGIASSHTLTLVMSAMVIMIVCIVLWKRSFEPVRLFGLVKATVLTLAVNLAGIVPMLMSMEMEMNLGHTYNYIQASGTYLLQLFNSIVNNYQGDNVAGTASSEMSESIGFPVTLGLLLWVVWYYYHTKQNETDSGDENERGFMSFCWGMTVLTLFLSTVYMFYDYLDILPDQIYSILSVYQFPWRWLSFATLFGVFCTAVVAERKEVSNVFFHIPPAFILCTALVLNMGQIYSDQLRTSELYRFANNLYDDEYQLGSAEYLLYGTDRKLLSYTNLIYEEDQLSVDSYAHEGSQWLLTVENLTDQVSGIHIPLLSYNNYVAYDIETGETLDWVYGYNYRVYLYIPANYSGTVAIEYQLPILWKLAIAISVIVDGALISYMILMRKKKSKKMVVER